MPLTLIDSVTNKDDTVDLPDFEHFQEDECLLDVFNLSNDELEALYTEDTVQWFPMNNPAGKLGIQVNELGEVRSTNPEVHLMEGEDLRLKMSKFNKNSVGKLHTVFIYRAGKQKLYDFDLGVEVFKTFNKQYSAYQLKLRYENRDSKDCSLINLSVEDFILPKVVKGRTVTDDEVVLKGDDYWMDMVGNGNNIIGNYKVSASGIPAYYDSKEGVYLRVNFTTP